MSSDKPETDDFPSLPDEQGPAQTEGDGGNASGQAQDVDPEGRVIGEDGEEQEEEPKLNLEVEVQTRSACERHIVVKVAQEDVARYFDKEFSELMSSAQVPGFRPGRAPRKLVEIRFRKEIKDKVKSSLVLDSISQVNEQHNLAAISEPDFDLESVVLSDDGPLTYEFDLEVRPEFDVPNWKGLRIERPVREFVDADVDRELQGLLAQQGTLVPHDGPASSGDYIATKLTFTADGRVISSADEELIRIRPALSFHDGRIEKFDELMQGVRAGETRVGEAKLSDDAPNAALRGRSVVATFEVKEVKRLQLPELTAEILAAIGDFENEGEARDAIRDSLERQLEYEQHRRAREQITAVLTASATWELPPGLLKRQSERELVRAVMELQRAGFGDDQIRAYENLLRQNSARTTARALKEHFILEKIADEEKIEDLPEDYDLEIELIARQTRETPRRVRARLEKAGRMDVMRNQIIERKVIERILAQAEFADVPYRPDSLEVEALDRAAGGGEPESDIPEAQPEGKAAEAAGEPAPEAAGEPAPERPEGA